MEKSESGAQKVDFMWIVGQLNFRGGKSYKPLTDWFAIQA